MSKEHIGVGLRIRPLAPQQEHIQKQCVIVDNNRILLTNNHKVKQFEYQKVFDKHSDQQQIFENFGLPLIEDMFKGYNSCLIVYGQNQSGKTYTICGKQSQESKGIIPRIVDHINCKLYAENGSDDQVLYLFRVSYIDIYQQQIIDLLTVRKGIEVKIIYNKESQMQLKNLQIKSINKVQDIESYLLIGNRKRQYAFSKQYRNSQKTTSIFTIYYESLNMVSGQKILIGKFDIVDFHASQIIKFAQPQLQIKFKNKNNLYDLSTNSFKNVIQALAYGRKESTIPYNDSKVTKLLRQSIGGTTKTKILFHITPALKCYPAIIDSLRLASSCHLIENTPSPNMDQEHSISRQYLSLKAQQQKIEQQLIYYSQTNYQNWMNKVKQQQNQFITQNFLQEKYYEQYGGLMTEKQNSKQNNKNKISSLFNLFITLDNVNKHQIAFFKDNYKTAIQKMNQIQKDKVLGISNSFYGSLDHTLFGQSVGSKKHSDKERIYKQEINDLRLEYQQQREMLLNSLRQVEMKYKFYEKIAKNVVKKEEIDLIKMNSKYDSTKRSFQLPLFAIRDKKITHSSNYYSPNQRNLINSRSNSERRFLMSKLSNSKIEKIDRLNSPNSFNHQTSQKSSQKPKDQLQNDDYFQGPKQQKRMKRANKKEQLFKMGADDYEMVRSSYMQNKFKLKQSKRSDRPQNSSLSSSKGIKIIRPLLSTRFKFK